MNSGIYKITTPSGKFYVGGSRNLKRRFREHRNDLKNGVHCCKPLQEATDDVSNLEFDILEPCEADRLAEREQFYIDSLKPELNQFTKVGSSLGYSYSSETREKVRQAASNISEETRRRRSEAAKRQWADPEKRARTQAAIKKKMNTDETREKIRAVQSVRPPITDETRQRMSIAAKNRKR